MGRNCGLLRPIPRVPAAKNMTLISLSRNPERTNLALGPAPISTSTGASFSTTKSNLPLPECVRLDVVVDTDAHVLVDIGAGLGAKSVRAGFLVSEVNAAVFAAGAGEIG